MKLYSSPKKTYPITAFDQLKDKPIQVRRITPKFMNEFNKYNK